jgi:hypothetical protein
MCTESTPAASSSVPDVCRGCRLSLSYERTDDDRICVFVASDDDSNLSASYEHATQTGTWSSGDEPALTAEQLRWLSSQQVADWLDSIGY